MTVWTSDYRTGEPICAVCAAPRNGRSRCCKTAPHISFADFKAQYFAGDDTVNDAIAREFYSDYRLSDCNSLAEYIEQTTSYV